MSIDTELYLWHKRYENASNTVADNVDAAYKSLRDELTVRGVPCANDDRAENLVAAIMKYIVESETDAISIP